MGRLLQPLPQCREQRVLHAAVAHQVEQPGWVALVLCKEFFEWLFAKRL